MIDIFVCDDNEKHLNKIADIVRDILIFHELNEQLALITDNPRHLLEVLEKSSSNVGLYFLDIQLHSDLNGFQLAEQIREIDPRGYIVFISSHIELSYLSFIYRLEVLDFILKDQPGLLRQRICECMLTAAHREEKATKKSGISYVTIRLQGQMFKIDTNDLIVIHTTEYQHRLALVTSSGVKKIYGTIKEWAAQLSADHFIQCSASEIVNKAYIDNIDLKTGTIMLKNKSCAYFSTQYLKKYKKRI